ncbi:MAG TPA: hypothetical protein VEW94_03675 [Chloroflexia bacterium]|nr:hypothetical protein [Chloroflexia bacterium]
MAEEHDEGEGTPQSPEVQDRYVRDELDQDQVTHQGDYRSQGTKRHDGDDYYSHLGATDDEVVPVLPPMTGPADVVGEHNENAQGNETGDTKIGEELIDPREELTPG